MNTNYENLIDDQEIFFGLREEILKEVISIWETHRQKVNSNKVALYAEIGA